MNNSIIEKIKDYINEEENIENDLLRPQWHKKESIKNVDEISLDDLFWTESDSENNRIEWEKTTFKNKYEWKEIEFWNKNKSEFYKLLDSNYKLWEEFWILKDVLNILRWKYFFNSSYKTIDKNYQEMCNFFIKVQLKKNDIWIDNFLRYFDPESWFYKRVRALTLFRLLKDPKNEIWEICWEVSDLLYEWISVEPDSLDKSLNILKEYIDRVFSIKYRTFESRQEFISTKRSDSWEILCTLPDFQSWLTNYISGEEKVIIKNDVEEYESSEKDNNKEEKTEENKRIQALEAKIAEITASFNAILKQKDEENSALAAKLELVNHAAKISSQKQEETTKETKETDEDILEKRATYKILVIWWREKNNKKYNFDLKNWFDWELYEQYWIHPNQLWELYWDYDKQKTQKDFARNIENDLLLWNVNFVIILQTDHETDLYNKIINNSDFWSRITYFAEREENNANPKYSDQKYTKDRFLYYMWRAIEKYERAERNNDI